MPDAALVKHSKEISLGEAMDIGVHLAMAENHDNAITMFRAVLIHEPENFEAIERLGTSLFAKRQYHEALYWFWRGRKIEPRHPLALSNYGMCVAQLGHFEEGLADLQRAAWHAERPAHAALSNPSRAMIFNNLGNTLERLKRHEEALPILDKGVHYDPTDGFPHYNRGICLLRLNRHREAVAALQRSLDLLGPVQDSTSRLNEADARYNLAMCHLLLGEFGPGFANYEYRLTNSENDCPNLGLPADRKWNGEPIAGMRLLVHAEQGLGDTIQFLRFVPELVERGADVRMIVHKPIKPLAEAMPGVTVLETGAPLDDKYDRWVALMSLPVLLEITSEAQIPKPWWPEIEPERVCKWGDQIIKPVLERAPGTKFVGVCWAGNFAHKNNEHRSIDLGAFGKMFDAPCHFVSLQQMQQIDTGPFAELQKAHTNLSALWLDDLRDTAAVIRCLDLVITADTAVAHVAGSIGVPTWVLVPKYSTDWRWQLNRTDSPWYSSVQLVRQETIGDWSTVIGRLRQRLSAMAAQTRAA